MDRDRGIDIHDSPRGVCGCLFFEIQTMNWGNPGDGGTYRLFRSDAEVQFFSPLLEIEERFHSDTFAGTKGIILIKCCMWRFKEGGSGVGNHVRKRQRAAALQDAAASSYGLWFDNL